MAYRPFVAPRNIFYGPGALESLTTIEAKRALIVTDSGVCSLGLVERVEKILHGNNVETAVFDKVEPDPPKDTVWGIFSLAQDFKPDIFIGFGGGSSLDAGKAAWVLYEHPDLSTRPLPEITPEIRGLTLRHKAKYAAIPTTSGTGSEVTSVAVITDRDVDPPFKRVWSSPQLVPDVAIADPELASSMPPDVTANTGFDALVHAIECYVLTPPSDLIDSLALGAARTIWEWLPGAVANGEDMQSRDKMHLASLQAGLAFNNGRLGLVHLTAHDIGAVFHIPHGRANAFMLCPAFAFLYPTRKERFSNLATSLGISGRGYRGKTANLLTSLDQLKQKIGIPLAIKDTGLDSAKFHAQLDPIANGYMNNIGRNLANLPRDVRRASGLPTSADEVKALFTHAWNGTTAEIK